MYFLFSFCWLWKAQEVVEKFSAKLKVLGIIVRELTGDMQLSRAEAEAAHVSFVFQSMPARHWTAS